MAKKSRKLGKTKRIRGGEDSDEETGELDLPNSFWKSSSAPQVPVKPPVKNIFPSGEGLKSTLSLSPNTLFKAPTKVIPPTVTAPPTEYTAPSTSSPEVILPTKSNKNQTSLKDLFAAINARKYVIPPSRLPNAANALVAAPSLAANALVAPKTAPSPLPQLIDDFYIKLNDMKLNKGDCITFDRPMEKETIAYIRDFETKGKGKTTVYGIYYRPFIKNPKEPPGRWARQNEYLNKPYFISFETNVPSNGDWETIKIYDNCIKKTFPPYEGKGGAHKKSKRKTHRRRR